MSYEWKFPSNNGGQINGIANAGIETFNGRLIQSIARENCQNSLDAVRDDEKCAIVRFNKHTINALCFPKKDEFAILLKKARKYWDGNEKACDFLDSAIRTIEGPSMDVLVISDYNTTGLTGPFSDNINSAWSSLTKLDGGATKSGNTGGSFGIGKHAPFANSFLRTVFYRTKNIDGEMAAQGISRIISYPEDLDNPYASMTTGVGYFGDTQGNKPVEKINELDAIYPRTEIGTDIFVFGFQREQGWEASIIEEILKNFMVALYDEKLIVYVGNYEISKKTLEQCVRGYIKDKKGKDFKGCYSTYQVLVNPETKTFYRKFHDLGTLELKLLINSNMELDRRIVRVRKTGMKLFSRNPVSKVIMYSGILDLQGELIGKYFLKLEPPTHDKWEYDRANERKAEAKAYIKEIEDWEEAIVQEHGKNSNAEEIAVEDLGELLSFDGISSTSAKHESLADTVDKILIVQKQKQQSSLGHLYSYEGELRNRNERNQVPGTIDDEGRNAGVRTLKGTRTRKRIEKHKAKPLDGGEDLAIKDEENQSKKELESLRIIKVSNVKYKMAFFVPNNIEQGHIDILTIGENNKSVKIIVDNAVAENNIANVYINDGSIYFSAVQSGIKTVLYFEIGDDRNYAMEVDVYEHIQ